LPSIPKSPAPIRRNSGDRWCLVPMWANPVEAVAWVQPYSPRGDLEPVSSGARDESADGRHPRRESRGTTRPAALATVTCADRDILANAAALVRTGYRVVRVLPISSANHSGLPIATMARVLACNRRHYCLAFAPPLPVPHRDANCADAGAHDPASRAAPYGAPGRVHAICVPRSGGREYRIARLIGRTASIVVFSPFPPLHRHHTSGMRAARPAYPTWWIAKTSIGRPARTSRVADTHL